LEAEFLIPEKLVYSMSTPHKAWAAGDTLTCIFKGSIISKSLSVHQVRIAIIEERRIWNGYSWDKRVATVAQRTHDIHVKPSPPRRRLLRPAGSNRSVSQLIASMTRPHSGRPQSSTAPGPTHVSIIADVERSELDVFSVLEIAIPRSTTASHAVDPLRITHRISWTLSLIDSASPGRPRVVDVHESSLPIHVLDHRLLQSAHAATQMSRGLFFRTSEREAYEDSHVPPSYTLHVRDRIPSPPDSSAVHASVYTCTQSHHHTPSAAQMTTQTPSYHVATREFVSCVPPLDLMRPLPKYAKVE